AEMGFKDMIVFDAATIQAPYYRAVINRGLGAVNQLVILYPLSMLSAYTQFIELIINTYYVELSINYQGWNRK
ncbi:MAG: hypothetical protein JSW20_14200, partial [Nitrospiraceae bacterium]